MTPSAQRRGKYAAMIGMAAVAGAAVVASRIVVAKCRRRRLIESGQIGGLEERWMRVGRHRIFARVSSAAPSYNTTPVVLVHGWGMSSSYMAPMAERLAPYFNVYVPDLPGHGRSDTPERPLDARAHAEALLAWMDAQHVNCAVLIGHSMGSQIATEAALSQPARVERLVLIGMVADPQARTTAEQFRRFAIGGLYEPPSLHKHMLKDYARMGSRLWAEFRFMRDYPIERALPRITAPVMLVRGENDTMAPQRWIDEAARLLRTARVAVIPRAGHAVQFSAPDETVRAIQPFLATSAYAKPAP